MLLSLLTMHCSVAIAAPSSSFSSSSPFSYLFRLPLPLPLPLPPPPLHLHVVALMPEYSSLVISNLASSDSAAAKLPSPALRHDDVAPSTAPASDVASSVGELLLELCATTASKHDRHRLVLAVSQKLASAAAAEEEEIDGIAVRVVRPFLDGLDALDHQHLQRAAKRRRRHAQQQEHKEEGNDATTAAATATAPVVAMDSGGASSSSTDDDDCCSIPSIPSAPTESMDAAYLAFNHATPYLRFAHLTANQVMLEAMAAERRRQRHTSAAASQAAGSSSSSTMELHIVDVGLTAMGLQWPPLMQAIAADTAAAAEEVDHQRTFIGVRLTLLGGDADTGRRLAEFAASLRLPFQFFIAPTLPSLLDHLLAAASSSSSPPPSSAAAGAVSSLPEEKSDRHKGLIVLNCIYPSESSAAAVAVIRSAIRPDIVTIAGRHMSDPPPSSHSKSSATDLRLRLTSSVKGGVSQPTENEFLAFLRHFSAIYRSLDSTLSPSNPHRQAIENALLNRQIFDFLFSYHQRQMRHLHDSRRQETDAAGECSSAAADGRNSRRRRNSPSCAEATAIDEAEAAEAVDRLIRQVSQGRHQQHRDTSYGKCRNIKIGSTSGRPQTAVAPEAAEPTSSGFGTHESIVATLVVAALPYGGGEITNNGSGGRLGDVTATGAIVHRPLPLSSAAVAQAKLLLRQHYPSEGYRLNENGTNSLVLGWQNTPLFAFSAWHQRPQ